MIKIAITGSLASGKTTASKIISSKNGLLFSADKCVKDLYSKIFFQRILVKKLKIPKNSNIKKFIKRRVLQKKETLKRLGKIIHPFVRKKMFLFLKKNRNKKFLFFEIPLLVENKLTKYFDIIIFIKASKNTRLKRFILRGGNKELFTLLNNQQLNDRKKSKFCDHVVVNNRSFLILKNKLLNIMKLYE